MKYVNLLILIILTCLFAGCSDDSIETTPEVLPERGIVVKLTTGQLETKTNLYSQASLHHVNRVYAILYRCEDPSTTDMDINPAKTKVVTSQLLMKGNTPWNPSEDKSSYKPGVLQTETFKLLLPEEYISMLPGKYMILCVGLDDASGDTYGLTYDTEKKLPAFAQKGATLADAQAVFAKEPQTDQTKDTKDLIAYGQPDIARSELFAGWQAFDFTPDHLNVVQVELRRRVAGVLCYLSEIPYKLNIENTPYRVTKVRLKLHSAQNGQISLMRKLSEDGKPSKEDFGKPVAGKEISQILCEFDLMNFKSQKTSNGDLMYRIPTAQFTDRKQLENTILMGAYMLPIQNKDTTATLSVELLGYEYDNSTESTNNIIKDKGPGKVEATLIKSFPAIYEEMKNQKVYDILPNVIYHIGRKLNNDSTEDDYPESLLGTKVTVEIDSLNHKDIHVEFPSVPIVPIMSWQDKDGNKYKTEPEGEDDDFYIFDSIGSLNYLLDISASILYNDWELKSIVPPGSNEKPWIKFWDDEKQKFVTELHGSGAQKVKIQMRDYASIEASQNKQVTRTIILRLTAKDKNGKVIQEASSDMEIWQYNALIVKMESDEDGYRGFSHFDFGTERNPITGKAIENTAITLGWGFWSSLPLTPKWEDGYYNYEFLLQEWPDKFKESIVQLCGLGKYGQEIDLVNYKKGELLWYLAARDELLPFLTNYHNDENAHIRKNQFYWTCNQSGAEFHSVAGKFDTKKNKATWDREKKRSLYYARQACHAPIRYEEDNE